MGVCAGLDDDEQSDEGGGEGGDSASMAGSEADDGSDGEAGSEAGTEADGEEGGEGSEPECAAGSEADGEDGSHKRADGARKAKGRKGSRFVQHQAGHSSGSDGESATEDASDADSDGNLMGFTVPDDEASESDHETDEELEQPPARRLKRLQRTGDMQSSQSDDHEEPMPMGSCAGLDDDELSALEPDGGDEFSALERDLEHDTHPPPPRSPPLSSPPSHVYVGTAVVPVVMAPQHGGGGDGLNSRWAAALVLVL